MVTPCLKGSTWKYCSAQGSAGTYPVSVTASPLPTRVGTTCLQATWQRWLACSATTPCFAGLRSVGQSSFCACSGWGWLWCQTQCLWARCWAARPTLISLT